ncbi:MAG: hypothetical protein D6776_00855 [Planctomycetota bacterium]|nr:MAG: hypothetical protein D6776_00855 [Planctomycetota bacterium]
MTTGATMRAGCAALLLVALLAPGTRAATQLRWKLAPGECLLLEAQQQGAKQPALVSSTGVRTVYGADFVDGWHVGTPPGGLRDLLWYYVTLLPERPVGSRAKWTLEQTHPHVSPQQGGPISVRGRGSAVRKGRVYRIQYELELTGTPGRGPGVGGTPRPDRIASGLLRLRTDFDLRAGIVRTSQLELQWRDASGTEHSLQASIAPKQRIPDDPEALQREVDAAVARALSKRLLPYLKGESWKRVKSQRLGNLALVLYAALKAGLPPDDPVAARALAALGTEPRQETYSVALAILALEASGLERVPGAARGGSSRPRLRKRDLDPPRARLLAELARWLLEAEQPGSGRWWYKKPGAEGAPAGRFGDNSNTQFAVLALHAARRSRVPIPPALWQRVADHFLRGQAPDGPPVALAIEREPGAETGRRDPIGTSTVARRRARERPTARARGSGYTGSPNEPRYASMTAAAVSSMLIAHRWLVEAGTDPKRVARLRTGIRDGYAWLQRHHTMRHNWPYHGWPYYHLYSLEKAFEIGEVARIGGHDWWAEGARELLLREDTARGGWGTEIHTALAVLFLTRASAEPELEIDPIERARTGGGEQSPDAPDAVAIDGVGIVRVSELIAALETRDRRKRAERLKLLERAWSELDRLERPVCTPALARALDSSYREVRRRARALLEQVVGERVADAQAAMAFFARWQQLHEIGEKRDRTAIPTLRAVLRPDEPLGLRREAARALVRTGASSAMPDLIDELERARRLEDRKLFHGLLVALTGTDPGYDPTGSAAERRRGIERWRALWRQRQH